MTQDLKASVVKILNADGLVMGTGFVIDRETVVTCAHVIEAAGGAGYVLKRAADTELLSAIRAVWRGGSYLHPEHVRLLLEETPAGRAGGGTADESYALLSPRERAGVAAGRPGPHQPTGGR